MNLFTRRQDLADLYTQEMEMWRAEILAKTETQEDRKERCVATLLATYGFNINNKCILKKHVYIYDIQIYIG